MHLKVTNKRQGMDDAVYIFECKDTTQRLVDIVDQVLAENNIVVWGGRCLHQLQDGMETCSYDEGIYYSCGIRWDEEF